MTQSKRLHQLAVRHEALSVHFDLGLRAYEAGDLYQVRRHRAAVGILPEGGADSLEFLALRWRELWLTGERSEALGLAREAARLYPDDADTALDLSDILLSDFDQPEEALAALLEAARHNEEDADLWYEVGVAAEGVGAWELRQEVFRRVWELERTREPGHRLWVSEQAFLELAQRALERLPPRVRQTLGNVAIFVEDYPEEWIFDTDIADPRIMGLFDGPERHTEKGLDAVVTGPSRIHLYRWNIERHSRSLEDLEKQVEITIFHEIGHYLGLSEAELHYMGLG